MFNFILGALVGAMLTFGFSEGYFDNIEFEPVEFEVNVPKF